MTRIIDTHAHIFPDKIAEKATNATGAFYDLSMDAGPSTVSRLISLSKEAGISKTVVHSTATNIKQVQSINDYIISTVTENDCFIGYMTLHQDMKKDEIRSEIKRCSEAGLKGIKLHPDIQKFAVDDKSVYKIYEEASGKLPILFHAGDKRYDFSHPSQLAKVACDFPELTMICAHFGGYSEWDKVHVYKDIENVYFDTCSALFFLSPEEATRIILELGEDRFFFATDYSMWIPRDEIERFNRLLLTDIQREKILHTNYENMMSRFGFNI